MAETITLVIESESTSFTVASQQTLSVVDDAPDHGAMAGLHDDDHPQYITFVVAAERPTTNLRPGLMYIPSG